LSFFEELGAGITFQRPEISLQFSNSYGIPIGLLFNSIYGLPASSSDTTFISGTVTQSPQLIASPSINQVGQTLDSTLIIDESNSNLQELLASSPAEIGFDLRALINPNSTEERNFVQNTSRLDAEIEMRLPLSLRVEDLTRSIEFDYGELVLDEIDSLSMRIVTENQIPFDGTLSVEIWDEDSTVLNQIPERLLIAAPFLSRNGEVVQGEVNITNIPFGPESIAALEEGQYLSFLLTLNTPQTLNSQEIFVDFLAQYTFELKVSFVVKTNVDL